MAYCLTTRFISTLVHWDAAKCLCQISGVVQICTIGLGPGNQSHLMPPKWDESYWMLLSATSDSSATFRPDWCTGITFSSRRILPLICVIFTEKCLIHDSSTISRKYQDSPVHACPGTSMEHLWKIPLEADVDGGAAQSNNAVLFENSQITHEVVVVGIYDVALGGSEHQPPNIPTQTSMRWYGPMKIGHGQQKRYSTRRNAAKKKSLMRSDSSDALEVLSAMTVVSFTGGRLTHAKSGANLTGAEHDELLQEYSGRSHSSITMLAGYIAVHSKFLSVSRLTQLDFEKNGTNAGVPGRMSLPQELQRRLKITHIRTNSVYVKDGDGVTTFTQ
ncbi:hypothetical protein EDD85DRAFT_798661 [Armillaria nabsnona]|nr:hypothetical protein EDD85DRAFT_798661 [Armillaria nabsnona]